MPIIYDAEKQVFHLQSKRMSYVMQIIKNRYPAHVYWGGKITEFHGSNPIVFMERGFAPNPFPYDRNFSLDSLPLEYPSYGTGDFRLPAFQVQCEENGSTVTELFYRSYRIYKGKPKLPGLPATYAGEEEAQTLEIELLDEVTQLKAVLCYTVFNEYDVIARSVRFENKGGSHLKILSALSANVDFRDDDFDFLTLYGAYAKERSICKAPLVPGIRVIQSSRGASSHQENPFFALMRKDATEDFGEVYGFSLVYSGNFLARAQVDQFETVRASIGINPFDFSWRLEPGESFQTPEAVMAFSSTGLGGMSRTYHRLYRHNLCRLPFRDRVRPVLVNSWEATGFDFDEERILRLAKQAKSVGAELLVMDDGWFGERDNDRCSLGDWFENEKKLPHKLAWLANEVNRIGLQFGLWFEPEMVSENSKLYRAHPDWCLHVDGRPYTEGRSQLVLDLSRPEVCDYIVKSVSNVLSNAPISYVKWDMNRHMTEIGSAALSPERQRETAHRYMLGLYRVLEKITADFPNVLFESCSGGGGRFDAGMLYYMPQVWASDNTDAVCRLKIQYGTSIVYPANTICCHVSQVPNQQVGRITPLATRGLVAMSGNFGYELDLTKLPQEQKNTIASQIRVYKEIREIIQFGDFYRILNPFEGNETAWMFISQSGMDAVAFYFRVLAQPQAPIRTLRLKGLDPGGIYQDTKTKEQYGGDELMNAGLIVPCENGDFSGTMWRFRKV